MRFLASACALALGIVSCAMAKAPVFVVARPVADKPLPTRDPTVGYVMFRSDTPLPLHLMKYPSVEDSSIYAKMKADALAKERKRYPGKLANYRTAIASYNVLKRTNGSEKEPVKPLEPTEENFVFTPFDLLAGTSVGPLNRFAKGDQGKSVYLQSLTPGSYRIYGIVSVTPEAVTGTCYCMGSVKFTVKAGEITDLGTAKGGNSISPTRPTEEIDPRLKDWPIHAADYRAVGKLPNYFGITIGRIAPIKDVIEYDRDQIVDLLAEDVAVGN